MRQHRTVHIIGALVDARIDAQSSTRTVSNLNLSRTGDHKRIMSDILEFLDLFEVLHFRHSDYSLRPFSTLMSCETQRFQRDTWLLFPHCHRLQLDDVVCVCLVNNVCSWE